MGEEVAYNCPKCGKSYHFSLGVGMLTHAIYLLDKKEEGNLLNEYDGQDKGRLKKIFKKNKFVTRDDDGFSLNTENYELKENYGYCIMECQECGELYDKFYFELESKNEDVEDFIANYECEKCGGNLILRDQHDDILCPECGEAMEHIVIASWD